MKAAKAVVAAVAAVVTVLIAVLTDDAVTADEIGQIVAVIAGAIGVYWVPNTPTP